MISTTNKSIIVIGGGISGLSVLHFLKKKYVRCPDISIKLLEKSNQAGGTIKTIAHPAGLFECGPNGFLDSKETILQLIRDVNLESVLIAANPRSKRRFLFIKNQLHEIPTGLMSLLRFKPLSFFDKLRLPFEIFVSRGTDPQESVYEFGARRFGENFAKIFLGALVSGIYAGNAKKLHLKSVFPKISELEQKCGSILKGFMLSRRAAQNGSSHYASNHVFGGGRLVSFPQGMSQLTNRLYEFYKDSIFLNEEVQLIVRSQNQFVIHANNLVYHADEIFVCVPAYSLAAILNTLHSVLAEELNKIPYAPVAVVGLIYRKDSFGHLPQGFGYLTSGDENRPVMGVVFDSQIFPGRAGEDHELFRIMIGGTSYPEVIRKTKEELIALAREEISLVLPLRQGELPIEAFVAVWPRAIPQYNTEDIMARTTIALEAGKIPNFHIVSNFISGVSLNDCIATAQAAVEQSKF